MVLLTIGVFFLIIGLLVFVHELGHFIMAKRAKMTVEEFGFGFPPRIWGIKRKGTVYSINWIPLGGFVKILGENGESAELGSFASKNALSRFSVLIAGVTMNALLAWLLLSVVLVVGLPTEVGEGIELPASARVNQANVTIVYVESDSPASSAGFRPGDEVIAIDGNKIVAVKQLTDYTSLHAGSQLSYEIRRGGEVVTLRAIPRASPPPGSGALGVQPTLVARVSYPWHEALYRGMEVTLSLALQIVFAFSRLIGSLFTDRSLVGALTGPVGIAVLTRDALRLGFANLIYFTAVLSINLAIINALPFPALDGGRILFLLIEKLRRKKLNLAFENYANTLGFFILVSLLVWVSVRDFGRYSAEFANLWRKILGLFG